MIGTSKFDINFGKAVDLLLAVCMLVQEVADMLFHLGLTFRPPCTEIILVMGPLVLLCICNPMLLGAGNGPVTSYMHACSGSGRHVIPIRIDIRVTMY